MPSLTGTKRPAETSPVASPTKNAEPAKRIRTHYDYYEDDDEDDDDEEEEIEEMQWSGDDRSDESSVMDLDDADELDDDFEEQPVNAEKKGAALKSSDAISPWSWDQYPCRKKCTQCTLNCHQTGRPCESKKCGCPGEPLQCDNRFSRLDTEAIFGPGDVTLHPCFVNWLAHKCRAVAPEWITTQFLFDIVYDEARPVPSQDDGTCAAWNARWNDLLDSILLPPWTLDDAEVLALQQELLRRAFTCAPGNSMFYSFCLADEEYDGSEEEYDGSEEEYDDPEEEYDGPEEEWDGPWRSTASTGHCRSCGKCAVQFACPSPGNHEF